VQDHPVSARVWQCTPVLLFSLLGFLLFVSFSEIGQMSGNSNFIHKFQLGY